MLQFRVPQQLAVLPYTVTVKFMTSSITSTLPRKVLMLFAPAARDSMRSETIALHMLTAVGSLRGPFALAPVGGPTEFADELLSSHRSGLLVSGRSSRRW